ncbi:glycosyltransferase family 4 protein [uncultured Arcobacter sp.]|uniref:glycosyltransferase family 4 protein n=1 Tax=uncultured Arcobacter sp. TaxID=165434 RepID=UPI0026391D49|nr:glycosyltransferase family 4 protein [uncultured Arcobacter sp.]
MEEESIMKIVAIVLNSSWQAYNFRLNLAREIKNSGYKVIFIAPYDNKYSEFLKKEFEFFHIYIDPKGINPIGDFKTLISFYKLYKKIKLDMVLNFTIKPNIYSSIISKILGIKSINNITGLGTVFIKKSIVTTIVKLLYKISLSCCSKVFFQNNDDKSLFLKNKLVSEKKCGLIPGSGVDTKKFTPILNKIENTNLKFLVVARVLRDKGIYEYIDAIKIIKSKYENIDFQLLGEVGVQNKTAISEEELNEWVNQGLVDYLGTSDKVQNILKNVNCVILPSYREGTPRSLLEAASMEKPIITTNVVGCKEVVEDGVNGYLCEVRSSEDLARKIEMFINLPCEKKLDMGKEGRKKMLNEFSESIVIKEYLDSIKEILR